MKLEELLLGRSERNTLCLILFFVLLVTLFKVIFIVLEIVVAPFGLNGIQLFTESRVAYEEGRNRKDF